MAKGALEGIRVTVIGEVSECNDKSYSAAFFSIGDDQATMPCVMWKKPYEASGVKLRQGMLVEVTGSFTAYVPKGRMQFSVHRLRVAGEGELRMRVEELARKLAAEGLMDPARKRPLPAYPERIGLVTSPRGKAVWDVIRTLRRRYPMAEILFAGVTVEGDRAAAELVDGMVAVVNGGAELLLLGRGGGSYEDLMPFNNERLARTISRCPIPVVTGIGHEPDNSIADMVADLRCSTPTAAAEKCTPSFDEIQATLESLESRLAGALERRLGVLDSRVSSLASRPVFTDPHAFTGTHEQGLDMLADRLYRAIPNMVESRAERLRVAAERFERLTPRVCEAQTLELGRASERLERAAVRITEPYAQRCDALSRRLSLRAERMLDPYRAHVARNAQALESLSPLAVLARGYAVAYGPDARIVHRTSDVAPGDEIEVQVADGRIAARVTETRPAQAPDSNAS